MADSSYHHIRFAGTPREHFAGHWEGQRAKHWREQQQRGITSPCCQSAHHQIHQNLFLQVQQPGIHELQQMPERCRHLHTLRRLSSLQGALHRVPHDQGEKGAQEAVQAQGDDNSGGRLRRQGQHPHPLRSSPDLREESPDPAGCHLR